MTKMATAQRDKRVLSICQFNFLPMEYIHASWLTSLPTGVILERLRYCQRAMHRLSRYLLAQFKLDNQYWFDFGDPVNRIALLQGHSLIKLVFYTGLAVNADAIRRTVQRDKVIKLKNAVSQEAYIFAVKRAPFLWPITGDTPTLPTNPYHLRNHLALAGMGCLEAVFYPRSPALTQRLLWKLPMGWCSGSQNLPSPTTKQETIPLLLYKLAKELELT